MKITKSFEQARLQFFKARIRQLISQEKWPEALTAVIDLAQWCEDRETDSGAWLDLLVTATEIVGHLDDPAEYRAFLAHFGVPFLGEGEETPQSLLEAFALVEDTAEPAVMVDIGRWLCDARHDWPLGPYLAAHFIEIRFRTGAQDADLRRAVEYFDIAAERAAQSDLAHWRLHCLLRKGSLLLTSGQNHLEGRRLLGSLDWTQLAPVEQLWMAVALASSPIWTDRLRAMDILLDLNLALKNARPHHRDLHLEDLRRAAATIFKLAGLHLPEAEDRRLEELSDALFLPPRKEQWKSYLQARRQLSKVAALPLSQSEDVADLLDKLANLYPARWRPVAHRFRIIQSGWTADYRSNQSAPAPKRHDVRLPVADAIAAVVQRLRTPDGLEQNALVEDLKRLNASLATLSPDGDTAAARPLALLWSALFENTFVALPDDVVEELTLLAERHTLVAPAPSYGWWTLAAYLYRADLPAAARHVAERALTSQPDARDETARFVIAHRYQEAVAARDLSATRRWIQIT